ncbi:NmrA family transcriptional regulator [Longimycelium tulufanense]|uniref:NmrA family transcriptional regulator n=1 Tax=Longimycelium tulufanense TaxID=907463 RepID=A0A8J3FX19_9PSEU|nr:NmrA family transcriptional regulator [Longimycelium tulufanense]
MKVLLLGGRGPLVEAARHHPAVEPVTLEHEAVAAVVDLGSLTPAAQAEATRYPLAGTRLPLVVISAIGVDTATTNPYLAEMARAERLALDGRERWWVLRCAPLGEDLVPAARQLHQFGAVYAGYGTTEVPWLAATDVLEMLATLLREGQDRWGHAYELTGAEAATAPHMVEQIAQHLGRPGVEYHELAPESLVASLVELAGFDPGVAVRIPPMQDAWAATGREGAASPTVERALGRPPRPLAAQVTDIVSALTAPA